MRTWTAITDALSPRGRRQAAALAARGKDLVLIGEGRSLLEVLASELRVSHQVDVRILVADLAEPNAVAAVARWLEDRELTLDGIVALSGSAEQRANVELLIDAVLPEMRRRGFGSVVRDTGSRPPSVAPPPASVPPAPRARRSTAPGHRDPSAPS
jgi:hypothetical protein